MSQRHQTAPEDRISFPRKVVYGVGGFVNNLLASAIGNMSIVLILVLGMSPWLAGLLGSLPRFTDAITDPVMGFVSDRTRTRWGRRRPYIFLGAILSGLVFVLLWQMPAPTQLRVKLVDYGADAVYSGGETGQDRGVLEAVGDWARSVVSTETIDDVEHEVVVTPPALVAGAWVSLDLPLSDFTNLTTRWHLAQLLLSGDLEDVYLDNAYFYRLAEEEDGSEAEEDGSESVRGSESVGGGAMEGLDAPLEPAPEPIPRSPDDVISLFSDAYDDMAVGQWSTEWDRAQVADVQVAGNAVKHYSDLRFAAIDFGEQPVDASEMTHLHLDVWTPNAIQEGKSQAWYFWYFLIGSVVFFVGYTIFATPWVALGYELTPDYHERTRLMGVQNFVSNIAFIIAPWFLAIMTNPAWFRNQMQGARSLAVAVAVATIGLGVLPAIFLRERNATADGPAGSVRDNVMEFLRGLVQTVRCKPFLMLCLATFLIFNGFIMIASFQIWVFIHHVYAGSTADGAALAGLAGTFGIVFGFVVIAFVTWMGTKIGKRHALIVSTSISIFGYALKWFCYTPEHPMLALLPAPFLAFGLGGLFTLMGSMVADVVDLDEISTGERREGMFGSIYWWVVKLGQSLAVAGGGFLLTAAGFDETPGAVQSVQTLTLMRAFDAFVPLLLSAVALWAIVKFPITEESARQVRAELERRRAATAN